jgi:hypothetical protein
VPMRTPRQTEAKPKPIQKRKRARSLVLGKMEVAIRLY